MAGLTLLPDVVDRNRFALRPYRLHHELVEQLQALRLPPTTDGYEVIEALAPGAGTGPIR